MAGFDYAKSAATALRLIARFGAASVGAPGDAGYRAVRRMVPGGGADYDPGTPTATDYPCTMVVVKFATDEIDGRAILADDRKVLIAPTSLAIEPEPSTDFVVIGAEALTIVPPVGRLRPAGTDVLWTLQCRG